MGGEYYLSAGEQGARLVRSGYPERGVDAISFAINSLSRMQRPPEGWEGLYVDMASALFQRGDYAAAYHQHLRRANSRNEM